MAGESKRCGSCDETKSLDDFYFHKTGRRAGKPMSVCKSCNRAAQNERYARRKAGDLLTAAVAEQSCGDCEKVKPSSDFGVDHARPSGIKRYCRPCANLRTVLSRYGLTREAHASLPTSCEVCNSTDRLVVDHDHETGEVRGILCDDCNVALGRLKDDADRAMGLAFYLVRSSDVIGAI